ncbi:DUF7146 domain-containing protein [Neoroseomonas rubea]|uniref:DUF7146 domain-containing protein n=1 Tax=Neoroseomonas rubea TaxID=2748666 RepID=UPI0018DF4683|nr:toprim domain-containing protein [Roseomonas rubea]
MTRRFDPDRAERMRAEMDEILVGLRARIVDLAICFYGQPIRKSAWTMRFRSRDAKGDGKRTQVVVNIAGGKAGFWKDFSTDQHGSPLKMIECNTGLAGAPLIGWARDWLGMPTPDWSRQESPEEAQARRAKAEAAAHAEAARRAKAEADAQADEARRIRAARALWAAARPIGGTLAERYLSETRAIGTPAAPWPDAVRFLPRGPALIVAATDDQGEVRAVQAITIGPDARKQERDGRAKTTTGVQADAAVRLPGVDAADQWIIVAEGPETALTAWAASGRATIALLGQITPNRVPWLLRQGRRFLILREDHADDRPVSKNAVAAIAALRAAGAEAREAWPWAERGDSGADLNDVAQWEGMDAVRAVIHAALGNLGHPLLPIDAAREATRAAVTGFVMAADPIDPEGMPDALLLRVSGGVGKTAAAIEASAKRLAAWRRAGITRSVVIAVPTHRLTAQIVRDFNRTPEARAARLIARVWRGRENENPDDPKTKMCENPRAVAAARAIGANVQAAACGKAEDPPAARCPFFDGCAYQRQRQGSADLWVVPHNMLFDGDAKAFGTPGLVIVDEQVWSVGLRGLGEKGERLTIERVGTFDPVPGDPHAGDRLMSLRGRLAAALRAAPAGPLRAADLEAERLTAAMAREARALENRRLPKADDLRPGMPADERNALVERLGPSVADTRRLATLWRAVEALLERAEAGEADAASGWATIVGNEVALRWRRNILKPFRVRTLLIDAQGEADLVRPYWPALRTAPAIEADAPHERRFHAPDRALTAGDFGDEKQAAGEAAAPNRNPRPLTEAAMKSKDAARRDPAKMAERKSSKLRDLRAGILALARLYDPGAVLVVMQQRVEKAMRELGPLPANVQIAHHNDINGRNDWEGVVAVCVIGRTMPPPAILEAQAAALTGRPPSATRPTGDYHARDTAPIRFRDGRVSEILTERHPDPLVEKMRAQAAEWHLVQIGWRARGANRTAADPVDVFWFTKVALPTLIDEITTSRLITHPGPVDLMLAEGGIALLTPAHASMAFSEIWPTPKSAEDAMRRHQPVQAPPARDANSSGIIAPGLIGPGPAFADPDSSLPHSPMKEVTRAHRGLRESGSGLGPEKASAGQSTRAPGTLKFAYQLSGARMRVCHGLVLIDRQRELIPFLEARLGALARLSLEGHALVGPDAPPPGAEAFTALEALTDRPAGLPPSDADRAAALRALRDALAAGMRDGLIDFDTKGMLPC